MFFEINGRERLIDRERQDEFSRLRTSLHMVLQECKPLSFFHIEHLLCELVDGEGHLLIFGIREKIVGFQVVDFLMLNHLTHEIHRRVVFSAVFSPLCRDGDRLELARFLNELDSQVFGFSWFQLHGLGDIAHGGHGQFFPLRIFLDGKLTMLIRHGAHSLAFIEHIGIVHRFTAS